MTIFYQPVRRCATPRCRRMARRGRRTCNTCRCRAYTAAHPDVIAFNNLKKSAKRRGIDFDLTIDEFRQFAIATDYLNKRGRSATSYHVDREREWEGYHIRNLQVLTNSENIRKSLQWRKWFYVEARIHGWTGVMPIEPF